MHQSGDACGILSCSHTQMSATHIDLLELRAVCVCVCKCCVCVWPGCCRIFVASRPEELQTQPERNCFAKADVFKGQNGWTGKPKADIWNADSQVGASTTAAAMRHAGLCSSHCSHAAHSTHAVVCGCQAAAQLVEP